MGFVFVDVKSEVGIADYVEQAKQVVADEVDVPDGYRLAWAGQFQYFERAKAKLQVVVPATLLLIFFTLFFAWGVLTETLVVLLWVRRDGDNCDLLLLRTIEPENPVGRRGLVLGVRLEYVLPSRAGEGRVFVCTQTRMSRIGFEIAQRLSDSLQALEETVVVLQ